MLAFGGSVWGLTTLECLHFTGQHYLHICKCNKHGSHPLTALFVQFVYTLHFLSALSWFSMRYVVYVEVIYLHFCLHYLHFVCTTYTLSALHTLCLHYIHFCLHFVYTTYTFVCTTYTFVCTTYTLSALPTLPARVTTWPNSIGDAFAGHRESRFSVTPTNFTPSLYPHSVPAQHIICLYMQDNADEVQVVQAV